MNTLMKCIECDHEFIEIENFWIKECPVCEGEITVLELS